MKQASVPRDNYIRKLHYRYRLGAIAEDTVKTEQRLQLITHIFGEVNRTYFDGVIPTPTFCVSTRLQHTAGQVCYATWTMEISAAYHDHYGWERELLDTIKHEAIHLYLFHAKRHSGHTKEFTAICERIGAPRYSKSMPRRRPRYRYLVQCPHCWARIWRGSWNPTIACRSCCETYNDGRYSPEFAFNLLKREIVHEPPQRSVVAVRSGAELRRDGHA